jgi:hypothetical protein
MVMIGLLTPSRERPHFARELIGSWQATTTGQSQLLFYIDANDPTKDRYPVGIKAYYGSQIGFAQSLNKLLQEYPNYEYYMMCNDDVRFRTPGWEDRVLKAFSDHGGLAIVWCNDQIRGAELCTLPFMPKRIIDALGWMVPPYFDFNAHLYNDNVIMDIGKALGILVYLESVVIEHMHVANGRQEWDDVYRRTNASEMYKRSLEVYEKKWLPEAPVVIKKLKDKLNL